MTHSALPPFSCWAGPRRCRMLLLGEAWGREESESGFRQPFVGVAGRELWRMLGEAIPDHVDLHHKALSATQHWGYEWVKLRRPWLEACSIAMTNVLNFRPPNNKLLNVSARKTELPSDYPSAVRSIMPGRFLLPEYLPELDRLEQEISESQPNLIVALGNTAVWALEQHPAGISACRGTVTLATRLVQSCKVLPTYHPAALFHGTADSGGNQWHWRPIIVADLMKAWRESAFPEVRRPDRQILIKPTIDEMTAWTKHFLQINPPIMACDIETKGGQITCIGFGAARDSAMIVPFLDESKPGWSYWSDRQEEVLAWKTVRELLYSPIPKLFQNGVYDLQYLYRYGLRPVNVLHDTMLLHHALHPEMQKGLGFLGSIYTSEPAWKLMRRKRADTEKRDE